MPHISFLPGGGRSAGGYGAGDDGGAGVRGAEVYAANDAQGAIIPNNSQFPPDFKCTNSMGKQRQISFILPFCHFANLPLRHFALLGISPTTFEAITPPSVPSFAPTTFQLSPHHNSNNATLYCHSIVTLSLHCHITAVNCVNCINCVNYANYAQKGEVNGREGCIALVNPTSGFGIWDLTFRTWKRGTLGFCVLI